MNAAESIIEKQESSEKKYHGHTRWEMEARWPNVRIALKSVRSRAYDDTGQRPREHGYLTGQSSLVSGRGWLGLLIVSSCSVAESGQNERPEQNLLNVAANLDARPLA